jgi:CRISPR-associated Csx10 family RAMP protein
MSDWRTLDVQITLHSPLQLGTESGIGTYETTNQVIPGAVLRSAVAEAALAECSRPEHVTNHAGCPDRPDCPFWQIFGTEEPLWGFAYPAKTGPAWPLPLTSRTCKLYPGYDAGDGETYHGVYDILIGQFVYDLLTDPAFPLRDRLQPELKEGLAKLPALPPTSCPKCGGALKPAMGVYAWDATDGPLYAGRLSVRRATHVGINRARGVAEDAILFTQETIEVETGGVTFHTRVNVPAAKVGLLRPYLNEQEYLIGQGRSRGNGHVKLSVTDSTALSLSGHLEEFNRAITAALNRASWDDERVIPTLPGTLFSITLCSPMILEQWGQPLLAPTPVMLGLPDATLLRAWARPEVVGGWDQAARLPRRTRLAVQSGSVFLFWTSRAADDADLLKNLSQVDVVGLGEERPRGYGHVKVCDPFHRFNRIGERSEK